MERTPDYIGAWDSHHFAELSENLPEKRKNMQNHFQLFIDSSIGERFNGTTLDKYGVADINGVNTKEFIEFKKKYRQEAITNGSDPNIIKYRGIKTKGQARGLEDEDSELVAGIINQPPRVRVFIMKKVE